METKKFGGFVSAEQKKELVEFLEQHPELKSGKFTNKFTYKSAQDLWNTLSNLLNSLPGANKEWKQWRKTWQDMKSMAKRKNTLIKNHKVETGGGPPIKDIVLTNDDEKIIEMLGTAVVEGDPLVAESKCSFDFDNNSLDTINCEIIMEIEQEESSEIKINKKLQQKRNIEMLTSSTPSSQTKTDLYEMDTPPTKYIKQNSEYGIPQSSLVRKIKENATPSSQTKNDYGMDRPSTSQMRQNPDNITPPTSLEKKKENVSTSITCQSNKENLSTSGKCQSKRAPLRVQRFNKTQEANSQLLNLTSNRNQDKLDYSNKKVTLYKRDVEAKESIAKSLDLLVNYFINQKP